MINRMSILATSAVTLRNDYKIVNKEKVRKVEPVSQKDNGDPMRENPYSTPNYIYYKDMKKVNEEEKGKHIDIRI